MSGVSTSDVLAAGEARRLGQGERGDTLQARNSRLAVGEAITVRVRRSDTGGLAEFRVPYRKWMRVLDALNWIAENAASDLAYRWFCKLGLDGCVPDHSTFSKNRHGRFRESDLLRRVFEVVLSRCGQLLGRRAVQGRRPGHLTTVRRHVGVAAPGSLRRPRGSTCGRLRLGGRSTHHVHRSGDPACRDRGPVEA